MRNVKAHNIYFLLCIYGLPVYILMLIMLIIIMLISFTKWGI